MIRTTAGWIGKSADFSDALDQGSCAARGRPRAFSLPDPQIRPSEKRREGHLASSPKPAPVTVLKSAAYSGMQLQADTSMQVAENRQVEFLEVAAELPTERPGRLWPWLFAFGCIGLAGGAWTIFPALHAPQSDFETRTPTWSSLAGNSAIPIRGAWRDISQYRNAAQQSPDVPTKSGPVVIEALATAIVQPARAASAAFAIAPAQDDHPPVRPASTPHTETEPQFTPPTQHSSHQLAAALEVIAVIPTVFRISKSDAAEDQKPVSAKTEAHEPARQRAPTVAKPMIWPTFLPLGPLPTSKAPPPVTKPIAPKIVPPAKAPPKVTREEPEKVPEPPSKPEPKTIKKIDPSSNLDLVGPKPRTFETLMNNAN